MQEALPYKRCNEWLEGQLARYSALSDVEFAELVARLQSLPHDITPATRRALNASALPRTVSRLVERIRAESGRAGENEVARGARRLTTLWKGVQRVAHTLDTRALAGLLMGVVGAAAPADHLKEIRHRAAGRTPSLDSALEAILYEEAALALRYRRELRFKSALSGAEAAGVYFGLPYWMRLARLAGECQDGNALALIVAKCTPLYPSLGEREWGTLIFAVRSVHRSDLAEKLWAQWSAAGDPASRDVWRAFAFAANETKSAALLRGLLAASESRRAELDSGCWQQLVMAAGVCEEAELLDEIWHAWESLCRWQRAAGVDPSGRAEAVWGAAANASAQCGQGILFKEKIWPAYQELVPPLGSRAWGSFAKAARRVGETVLTNEVWRTYRQSGCALDIKGWGAFAGAAGAAQDGALLEEQWRLLRSLEPPIELNSEAWGSFVHAAGEARNPRLLRELFAAWVPSPDTLGAKEHAMWGSLFSAAFELKQEDLVQAIFRKLCGLVDPVRRTHWGTIPPILRQRTPGLRNRSIADEIFETLMGLRLDTERCMHVLMTTEPVAGYGSAPEMPFEGAGRCFMRWLINSYFHCDTSEFERRLSWLVEKITSLERNRFQAWHALLCRGQDAYFGALNSRYQAAYRKKFASVDELDDAALLVALLDGSLAQGLRELQEDILEHVAMPQKAPEVAPGCPVLRLLPVIDLISSNQIEYRQKKQRGTPDFFPTLARLMEAAHTESFGPANWADFLRLLLYRVSQRLWDELIRGWKDHAHSKKNDFVARYQVPLLGGKLTEIERLEFLRGARLYLVQMRGLAGGYRIGERKPINIARSVRQILVGKWKWVKTTRVELPTGQFNIVAWDGATEDLLAPMLRELRSNVDSALEALPEDRRSYHVSLTLGENMEEGYGVLTVSNAFQSGQTRPLSTGQGNAIIKRLASVLEGFALADSKEQDDYDQPMWTWRIVLPLWSPERG